MADDHDCCDPSFEEIEVDLGRAEAGLEMWKTYALAMRKDLQSIAIHRGAPGETAEQRLERAQALAFGALARVP